MADGVQFTVRGPKRWESDLDALIPVVAASPFAEALVGKVTRSAVLRVVIEAGFKALRQDHLPTERREPDPEVDPMGIEEGA